MIAANLSQVLGGLDYIHTKLNLYHGSIRCDNILLHRSGHIKIGEEVVSNYQRSKLIIAIANIGQCAMDGKKFTEVSGREDARCLGYMMVELMEVKTSILHPKSIELVAPGAWENSTGIKDFLLATQQNSVRTLKDVIHPNTTMLI